MPYEAENIRKATVKYLAARPSERLAPFNFDWLLKFHKEMFGDVWSWAGKLRTTDLTLGTSWQNVPQEFGGLVFDIQAFSNDESQLLEQAVDIHYRAVRIHPFENGRWSRMLANIWLRRHGKAVIEWPEAKVGKQASDVRKEYISAIKAANSYDFQPLLELHKRFWPDT